jgi:hypothetical protein
MKSGTDDIARLRTLFAAERSANFPEFTGVYCVDAADDVLARFARARRGDPHAALQFLMLSKDAGAFTGTALLAAILALPLTALGLRAVYRRDADAFIMYTFLQLGLVLALCFLSVASLTVAANGRVSATVRFHRASVGCACLVQLLTSSATTYSSFGVHALFGA